MWYANNSSVQASTKCSPFDLVWFANNASLRNLVQLFWDAFTNLTRVLHNVWFTVQSDDWSDDGTGYKPGGRWSRRSHNISFNELHNSLPWSEFITYGQKSNVITSMRKYITSTAVFVFIVFVVFCYTDQILMTYVKEIYRSRPHLTVTSQFFYSIEISG